VAGLPSASWRVCACMKASSKSRSLVARMMVSRLSLTTLVESEVSSWKGLVPRMFIHELFVQSTFGTDSVDKTGH
jgi:hypothetical protein